MPSVDINFFDRTEMHHASPFQRRTDRQRISRFTDVKHPFGRLAVRSIADLCEGLLRSAAEVDLIFLIYPDQIVSGITDAHADRRKRNVGSLLLCMEHIRCPDPNCCRTDYRCNKRSHDAISSDGCPHKLG
jgi:hypothetical protein